MYEWSAFLFLALYCSFLAACYRGGVRSCGGAGAAAARSPPPPRPVARTAAHLGLMLLTLCLCPWWGDLLRIEAFAPKVLVVAGAGVLSCCAACCAAASLAAAWYSCGRAVAPHRVASPGKQPRAQPPLEELKVT